jgi:hypothetical protein
MKCTIIVAVEIHHAYSLGVRVCCFHTCLVRMYCLTLCWSTSISAPDMDWGPEEVVEEEVRLFLL